MPTTRAGILVLDDQANSLGPLSLALVGANLGVVYTNDLDEMLLLAAEQPHPACLALVANDVALRGLCETAERLTALGVPIIPTGERPSASDEEALRRAGTLWAIWDTATLDEALYVVSAALWDLDPAELRFEPRAPVDLPAMVELRGTSHPVKLRDLSAGGACILARAPLPTAESVVLRVKLDGQLIEAASRVAWAAPDGRSGLCFEECGRAQEALLRKHGEEWMSRYRLGAT